MLVAGSIAAFLAFLVKGIIGFANTLVFTSILSFFAQNRNITPVDLLLGIPANITIALKERRSIRLGVALPLIAMLFVGMVPGVLFLRDGQDTHIKVLLGLCIMGLSVEMFFRFRGTKKRKTNPLVLLAIGVVSGFLSGLFGVGAFLVAYLGRTSESQAELRGTISLVFLADNIFRFILYLWWGLLTWEIALTALQLAPAMVLGLVCGLWLSRRIPEKVAQNTSIIVLFLMGLSVFITNLL